MVPTKAARAVRMASSSGRTSLVAVTSPSKSSVERASPKRSVKRYSFRPSMTKGTVLVASPSAIGSTPLASGSSVPPWPAFCAPNKRRTLPTAGVEPSPTGLSSTTQPSILSPFLLRDIPAVYDGKPLCASGGFRQAAGHDGGIASGSRQAIRSFWVVLPLRRSGADLPDGLASAARPVRRRRYYRRSPGRRRVSARVGDRQPGRRPVCRPPVAQRRPSRLCALRGRHRRLRRDQSLALLRHHLPRAAAAFVLARCHLRRRVRGPVVADLPDGLLTAL